MKEYTLAHLVKTEDLNHHSTLFAGRLSEWFVEAAFIAAASKYGNPDNIVCLKIHGLKFTAPATKGDILTLTTKVAYAGNTSLTVYGKVSKNESEIALVEGFITFICVDENGKKMPHNLTIIPETEEDKKLYETAKNLR